MSFIIANCTKKEKGIRPGRNDYVSQTCHFVGALLSTRAASRNVNSRHKCNVSFDFNLLSMSIALRRDLKPNLYD